MNLILASTSPRRQEILRQLGFDFVVIQSDFVELDRIKCLPEELVKKNSYGKAMTVAKHYGDEKTILAADTVVSFAGEILGKPKDERQAIEMLKLLSSNTHKVFTGLCLVKGKDAFSAVEETLVTFRELSVSEITSYVKTKEPLDKAGSYGIQAKGAMFVEKVNGCYYNVVGLPVVCLLRLLKKAGIGFEY